MQRTTYARLLAVPILCIFWLLGQYFCQEDQYDVQDIPSFGHLAAHCANMKPISALDFHSRQQELADKLHSLGAAAYIAEPGSNALYFANISLSQWRLSERPFLLAITPMVQDHHDAKGIRQIVKPQVFILTPQFESSRARLLQMPISGNITFVEWAESENPYKAMVSALKNEHQRHTSKIFVDEGSRFFVVDGIRQASTEFTIESSPTEIQALREIKSHAELELLRCANEVGFLHLLGEH